MTAHAVPLSIGILTFHFSDNSGALLQAYALRTWLRQLGHDASFVNYCPDHVESGGKLDQPWNPKKAKVNAKVVYLWLSRQRSKWFGPKSYHDALETFRKKELGVGTKAYKTQEELNEAGLRFDLLICGSDQIWNPSEHFGVDPVYFLDFSTECRRKISYAASFGSADLKPKFAGQIKKLLAGLDGLSVREEKAVGLVKGLSGVTPQCVPDPTFLLDDYHGLIKPRKPNETGHIFAYVLRSGQGFQTLIHGLRKELELDVVSAHNPHRRWKDFGRALQGGPIEWLESLNNSELVITNSFHATVFSILLNRPFLAVRLPGVKAGLSGRLENLLAKVGLANRMIYAGDVKAASEICRQAVDWDQVNAQVAAMRETGRQYLRTELAKL